MSRIVFFEGNPEGLVMEKQPISAFQAAVPEARNRDSSGLIQGRFPGDPRFGRQAKIHPGVAIDHSKTAAAV
jgi:hypothetical protein